MKYEVLHPKWCKYHGNMRFCIQNAVNTMEMKDSRSGSRGPYHWGGYGTGERDHNSSEVTSSGLRDRLHLKRDRVHLKRDVGVVVIGPQMIAGWVYFHGKYPLVN